MAEKVTRMLIKVDLQCGKCYRKIKKILCRFPQIRDQVYDEKANTVMITVVCCSPEKIKDKICCKGRDTILGIEIIADKPKPPPPKPAPPVKAPEPVAKPPQPAPPPAKAPEPVAKPPQPAPPAKAPEPVAKPPQPAPPAKPAPPPQPKPPEPLCPMPQLPPAGYPPVCNVGMCCCHPCYSGYGMPPPMCYDGCGRPAYDCHGGNRGYQANRCDYFSEENASGCTIM